LGTSSTGITSATNGVANTDTPMIDALADNGGFTPTCSLQVGSLALNNGSTTAATAASIDMAYDQRGTGFTRTSGGTADIGAYEFLSGPPLPEIVITGDTAYGSLLVASGSVSKTYTIQNTGNANLTISSITADGDFTYNNDLSVSTITSSSSATFTVTFDPTVSGNRTGTVTVNNNDSDEGTYEISVSGTGLVPILGLAYSGTGFTESGANDGSIGNSFTITLTNDTFTGIKFAISARSTVC